MENTERPAKSAPITIKKYANRRLYNTATSSYVTLDHLCQMVKDDVDFVVYDAKSGEDITRSVLTQIIVEEEAKGENLLPISFLRQLISFYGHGMRWMLPSYLEQTMEAFTANQEAIARNMQETMGVSFPSATWRNWASRTWPCCSTR
ncbi:polyhydroxyalkanoate synthesis repressor PhaR [Fodinicurvata halophila]|uniref:polyhydroxyalkanoate synthesis repressor PhaR n=1 Tax=Fodinicurvata halophila TaxID=1419723 RepID=UPI00362C1C0F